MGEKIIVPAWQFLRLHRAGKLKKTRRTSLAEAAIVLLILAAALASAISVARAADDTLYQLWEAMDASQRLGWSQAFVAEAFEGESIGRKQRLAAYVYGCALEYAPATGVPFAEFAAFCAVMARSEVE